MPHMGLGREWLFGCDVDEYLAEIRQIIWMEGIIRTRINGYTLNLVSHRLTR